MEPGIEPVFHHRQLAVTCGPWFWLRKLVRRDVHQRVLANEATSVLNHSFFRRPMMVGFGG